MKYYTTGVDIHTPRQKHTGTYETLEAGMLGLWNTSKQYEVAYLCCNKHTIAYMWHSLQDKRRHRMQFCFEVLEKLV